MSYAIDESIVGAWERDTVECGIGDARSVASRMTDFRTPRAYSNVARVEFGVAAAELPDR